MAMSLNLTGPIDTSTVKRVDKPQDSTAQLRKAVAEAMHAAANERAAGDAQAVGASGNLAIAASAPATYRVKAGDTVSGIATRYGLATASVLALNGLGWKSIIFPGQVLKLTNAKTSTPAPPKSAPPASSTTAPTATRTYTIARGDTISGIAARFGVSTQSILTANNLGWSTIIYPGQKVRIPGKAASAPSNPAPSNPAPTPPVVDIDPVVDVTPIDTAPAPQDIRYVIKSGDTVTAIAERFGVTVQAILTANGLTISSIIYAGRTIVIPGTASAPASVGGTTTVLTSEMATNARTIIAVGKSLGVSDYGLVIALSAAMQESSLRNLDYGDRDSLGLFQQRPSTGWGTPAQVTDTVYASRLFFGGPMNPNKGNTRGLLDISGWQSMTVTQAAQAVQRSAYPDAYAKWEKSARAWLAQLS
ncbi:LysM peptidoglycan-binding domain-containing protein [Terrimesophilobacter mesophilus]|uniref:LysM peptidoglycan-binding domain-containing protein n=2 Tax=Terrimesophilobacter mesophilus TaxID=433647 RepID=A0A4R8VBL1_9MICO|nr:LysM peptidoglycan-binding domain-containing protein [Terrimesophilobacter mesophilus]